jgi:drug/metabolite transporter (DMT)-like permease
MITFMPASTSAVAIRFAIGRRRVFTPPRTHRAARRLIGDTGAVTALVDRAAAPRTSHGLWVMLALGGVWVIWGSTYLAIRYGLETFDPFVMQAMRFVLASVVLGTVARWRGAPWPTWRQARNASLIGVMLLIGGVGVVTIAEDRGLSSGVAATIIAIQPMLASVWGGFFGRWPHRVEWLGMTIGLLGVVVLSLSGSLDGTRSGFALVLVACVSWSLGSMISRQIEMPAGAMASVVEMAAAAVGFTVLSVATGEELSAPSWRSGIAVLYLAMLGSVIAFTCYVYLLANVRPSLAMSYAYVNPVIAVVLGASLYGEVVNANLLIALPLVVAGVWIVTRAQSSASATDP